MRAAVEADVGHSTIRAFKIESEHPETKNLLIDATELFLSDYAEFATWLEALYRGRPASLDKDRSYVSRVQGFPRNTEIDARLTFRTTGSPIFGASGVADARAVPVGLRYSLVALPETPMQPRIADDRVGHFITAVWDYSRDRSPSPFRRYVDRWRLEKKDPLAPLSEPVKPIAFYVDRSVPHQYRRYVKEGIEAWNKAFEAAGFRNAVVALDPPEDSTWAAEDLRYSSVRWTADPGAWAIGPSDVDPRTGEILNADVVISASYVTYLHHEYQQFSGPDALARWRKPLEDLARRLPDGLRARLCLAGPGKAHQMAVQHALLAGLGVWDGAKPVPEEYLGDAIRDLVMQEIGHTLGLRHNFRGSSGIPYARLNDTAFTRAHGLTLSVMDYGAVNVSPNVAKQGDFWNRTVGTYDVWAIEYAYAPVYEQAPEEPFKRSGTLVGSPDAELTALQKIARRASEPLHTYGTDEDNWLGPFALDPLTNGWDLGGDPLQFLRDRVAVIHRVEPRLEERLIGAGEGYQRLRNAYTSLLFERFSALLPVTKYVGGMFTSRAHRGDPGGQLPFTPVPAADQRRAVALIVDHALAEDAFRIDPPLLNKLAPNRWAHWGVDWFTIPLDFPIHSWVRSIQATMLEEVLDPARLERMVDNEVRLPRGADVYPASELFASLTGAVWSEIASPDRPRATSSMRRNLQRAHLDQLVRLLTGPGLGVPEDARSLARYELKQLSQRMGTALEAPGLDRMTAAHLDESKARIDAALTATVTRVVR
jgi:hypothetical protein